MPGKIFVNYRRDDERAVAARVRDRLAQAFGDTNVFMDVDNLLAGQRFDRELEKALAQTDVLVAVIGPRWMELFAERLASGKRDYVREEIAGALKREITVIPVTVERVPLPDDDALPEDIRELVLHQKHVVTHEQFGRDVTGLVEAIKFARKVPSRPPSSSSSNAIFAGIAIAVVAAFGLVMWVGPTRPPGEAKQQPEQVVKTKEAEAARVAAEKAKQEEAERQRLAMLKADQERKRAEDEKRRAEADLLRPSRVFRDCPDVCPEMVVLPAGEFIMGSNEGGSEKPPRKVTIRQPFAVGKFEVTFAEWDACAAAGGCKHQPGDQGWGRGRRPVINVSWYDAKEYAAWLSRTTSKTYRLLSEAEWEYAARAGTTTRYAFGDTINKSQAQYSEAIWGSAGSTVEVGSFPANRFGLHDMHGNVWEWVEDNWRPDYAGAPIDGSVWPGGEASVRVLRGGSWFNFDRDYLRSAYRFRVQPDNRGNDIGFRLSRTL